MPTPFAMVKPLEVLRYVRKYFVTQSPTDIPDSVLGQLGNRVQHALRAYTPRDQKAVKVAAETFRANPAFDTAEAITNLETGEALVSFLDEKGAPSVVERAKILFPLSSIGAISEGQRLDINKNAPQKILNYDGFFDRESAYEVLTAQYEAAEKAAEKAAREEEKALEKAQKEKEKAAAKKKSSGSGIKRTIFGTMIAAAATSFARSLATNAAKSITGTKKSTSTSKKTTASKKTTTKKSSSSVGTAVKKAAKSAANTATRRITNDILKSLLK
ncbi:MAG: DUF853 family protein [Bacteroidales bacterium]|nr:DUF853 family protein [Bacteroidales bacterium]